MTDMKKSKEITTLVEEVKLFLRYAVPAERYAEALLVVERYRQDITALRLLREFYRSLPEVREEPVVRIVELAASQGVKLFAVLTDAYDYLYVIDADQVLFAGENGREIEEDAHGQGPPAGQERANQVEREKSRRAGHEREPRKRASRGFRPDGHHPRGQRHGDQVRHAVGGRHVRPLREETP